MNHPLLLCSDKRSYTKIFKFPVSHPACFEIYKFSSMTRTCLKERYRQVKHNNIQYNKQTKNKQTFFTQKPPLKCFSHKK